MLPVAQSFTVRGHGHQKTVAMSTFKAAEPYFEPASGSTERMFRPSDLGMQLLNDEVEFKAP